jgi:hypothetical protein
MGSRESRYIPDKQPSAGTAFNDCRKGSHGTIWCCLTLLCIQKWIVGIPEPAHLHCQQLLIQAASKKRPDSSS